MPLQIDKVHHYVKQPGENVVKLVKTNPYLRFTSEHGTVFLQSGHFWYEGGDLCSDRPAWLMEQVNRCSAFALKECGYNPDKEPKKALDDADQEVSKIRTPSESDTTRQSAVRRAPVVRRTGHGSVNRS